VRFPARDGLEYDRIRTEFTKADTDKSGKLSKTEMSGVLRALKAHPKKLAILKEHQIREGKAGTSNMDSNAAASLEGVLASPGGSVPSASSTAQDPQWQKAMDMLWATMVTDPVLQTEISFEQFRQWWPRDDATCFQVTTTKAEKLMNQLHDKGIGTGQ
jgi:hypothetical protein